jgi:hypothetical protein
MVRHTVGIVGALFMFVAVFLLSGIFLLPLLPDALRPSVSIAGITTNNLVGLALGAGAAASSYRATVRIKSKRSQKPNREQ